MSSTKREPLHDEVLEAEHFYNAVPVGLCVLSRDLRYLRVNERLAQIHGWPAEDHIGRTIEEVLPTVAPTLAPLISRVLETSQPLVDLDVTATTPAQPEMQRNWLASIYPRLSQDGTMQGISMVVHDITQRRRMQLDLAKSEERLRRLVESTNVIPWEADARTWRFTYVGPQAR